MFVSGYMPGTRNFARQSSGNGIAVVGNKQFSHANGKVAHLLSSHQHDSLDEGDGDDDENKVKFTCVTDIYRVQIFLFAFLGCSTHVSMIYLFMS